MEIVPLGIGVFPSENSETVGLGIGGIGCVGGGVGGELKRLLPFKELKLGAGEGSGEGTGFLLL